LPISSYRYSIKNRRHSKDRFIKALVASIIVSSPLFIASFAFPPIALPIALLNCLCGVLTMTASVTGQIYAQQNAKNITKGAAITLVETGASWLTKMIQG